MENQNLFANLDLSKVGEGPTPGVEGVTGVYAGDTPVPVSPPTLSPPSLARNSRKSRTSSIGARNDIPRSKSQKRKKEESMSKQGKKSKPGDISFEREIMEIDSDQAANANPDPNDPFIKMQAFMEAQFRATNENIKKMNTSIAKVNEKVGVNARNLDRLKTTVEQNSDNNDLEIQKLHSIIEEKEKTTREEIRELSQKIRKLEECGKSNIDKVTIEKMQSSISDLKAKETAEGKPVEDVKHSEFLRARRSLRLWPVKQEKNESISDAASRFVFDCLRVPHSSFSREDVQDVRKTLPRSAKRNAKTATNARPTEIVHDEIIITLRSITVRDFLLSHSFNLASYTDKNGKPTAGVRLEAPEHLTGQFQDFLAYGRVLHGIHGSGFKRNIKFDDRERSLYMDVKLPKADEWFRVDHDLAIENRRERRGRTSAITSRPSHQWQDGAYPVI